MSVEETVFSFNTENAYDKIKYFHDKNTKQTRYRRKLLQPNKRHLKTHSSRPSAVAHSCNPSTLGVQVGQITWGKEFKTSLANMMKPRLYLKNTKISQAWWRTPVIPATRKSKGRENFLNLGGRVAWAEIAPLHSSLGDRARLYLKKKKFKKN